MKRKNKQSKHLKQIRALRWNEKEEHNGFDNDAQFEQQEISTENAETECNILPQTQKKSPVECVLSTLLAGQTFTTASHFSAHMNQDFTSKSSFYRAQKVVSDCVKSYAQESMANAQKDAGENLILSGDGRYPIRRNSSHCTFDIFDVNSNKLLALGSVDKQSARHPEETFNQSSNMLESEALRRAIDQIIYKEDVAGIVLDGDNKNPKILEEKGFPVRVYKDPNHLSLCFNKYLDKKLSENKRMIEGIGDCFRRLRPKIKKWYSFLIHSPLDVTTKKDAWLNTVSHLLGNHTNCLYHKETKFVWNIGVQYSEAAEKLYFILLDRLDDFDDVTYLGTTQQNESFHREQLLFGNKNVNCPISQITRDYLAVLKHNEGTEFEFELRNRLELPILNPKNQSLIKRIQYEREKNSEIRGTDDYRKSFNIYRKKKSAMNKKSKFGDYKKHEEEEYSYEEEEEVDYDDEGDDDNE